MRSHRALNRDIAELGLDPTQPHNTVGSDGRLAANVAPPLPEKPIDTDAQLSALVQDERSSEVTQPAEAAEANVEPIKAEEPGVVALPAEDAVASTETPKAGALVTKKKRRAEKLEA